MSCKGNTGFLVNYSQFSKTSNNNIYIALFNIFFRNRSDLFNLSNTTVSCNKSRLCGNVRSCTPNVECTESQLGSGFTNTLCSNNAYSFTFLNHTSVSQVASITFCTDSLFGFTGKNRSYLNLLNRRIVNFLCQIFCKFLSRFNY